MLSLAVRARSTANQVAPTERMAACPTIPNCVSSLARDDRHRVEPFTFEGDPDAAWQRLREVVASLPGTSVVVDESAYLRAECSSRIFGFIDDMEFALERERGRIHVRSASRVGYSDLGVNRRRVGRVHRLFVAPARD